MNYPKEPTNNAEALQTLADFAKTAPGRLPERVTVALSIAELENGGSDLSELRAYIPAPTWRPIAELWDKLAQGDLRIVREPGYGRMPFTAQWSGSGFYDEQAHYREPTEVLDLAIPEVPNGY